MNYDEIVNDLASWKEHGFHRFGDDVSAFGGQVGVFPHKWVHMIFPPLPEDVLAEKSANFPFLKEFEYYQELKEVNGFSLFRGALELCGVYSRYRKAEAPSTVFDIYRHNLDYYNDYAKPHDAIVIGLANYKELREILVQTKAGEIIAIDFDSKVSVNEWEHFDAFLPAEISRLNALSGQNTDFEPDGSWSHS